MLSTILTRKPFVDILAQTGIRVNGAVVIGDLNLSDRTIAPSVFLNNCMFNGRIELNDSRLLGTISLSGSQIREIFQARRAKIDGSLILGSDDKDDAHAANAPKNIVNIGGIEASFLDIGGNLTIVGANINNRIYIPYSRIKGMLDIESVKSTELNAPATEVDGQFGIIESTFSLSNTASNECTNCLPTTAYTEGPRAQQEHLATINLFQLRAGHGLLVNRSAVADSIMLESASIQETLSISGTSLRSLDLAGASINGEFSFGYNKYAFKASQMITTWQGNSQLDFSNAKISYIRAPQNNEYWPKRISFSGVSIDGFHGDYLMPPPCKKDNQNCALPHTDYSLFSKIDAAVCHFIHLLCHKNFDANNWESESPEIFFPDWLGRATKDDFSPQSYREVTSMLEAQNEHDAAVEVGYAGKTKELEQVCSSDDIFQCWVMRLSEWTIGFGYFTGRAIVVTGLFVVVGALVFRTTAEAARFHFKWGLAYSFDMFLPIIRLREMHYKIDIHGPVRYYFYFHKLTGWILGSFIIAGLSGITK
ncbi:hypothetical protein [Paraburkholderia aromaticivorans]|uniref:hypothetical protein n=1 Tax=Paraburkholderia aromaticivorans TaxID=2026199 RepID=UPI0014560EC5|nr:hypothetical protein [Paraburkholderia aromaticivorans]